MRGLLASVVLLVVVVGCSSSSDDSAASACTIAGTYSNMGTIDAASRVGCTELATTGPATTVTITKVDDTNYSVGLQGLPGECPATVTSACKLQAKCDVVVASPTTAKTAGTLQAVWTFSATGFTGSAAASLPPNATYPNGCSYTGTANATRL